MTHALLAFLVAVTISHPAAAAASAHQRPTTPRTPADVTSDFNGDGYEDLAISVFNGDGYGDLAVGIWYEIVNSQPDAGAAAVIYGSASGLAAAGNQWWNQDSPGMLDQCEPNERAGSAVTGGDFNGDGYDDLAIG